MLLGKVLLLIAVSVEMEILNKAKAAIARRLANGLVKILVKDFDISRVILVLENINVSVEGIRNIFAL